MKIKLYFLKSLKIIVLLALILCFLFYLGVILPEYLACDKTMFEGEKGVNFFGFEVDCNAENQEIGDGFFKLNTLIIIVLSLFLLLIYQIEKKIKKI